MWLFKLPGYIAQILRNQEKIMADLLALTEAVEAQGEVIDSAVTLIKGLAEEIKNLEPTQEAIDALYQKVTEETTALSDAVVANTPAA